MPEMLSPMRYRIYGLVLGMLVILPAGVVAGAAASHSATLPTEDEALHSRAVAWAPQQLLASGNATDCLHRQRATILADYVRVDPSAIPADGYSAPGRQGVAALRASGLGHHSSRDLRTMGPGDSLTITVGIGIGHGYAGAGVSTRAGGTLVPHYSVGLTRGRLAAVSRTQIVTGGRSHTQNFEILGSGYRRDRYFSQSVVVGYDLLPGSRIALVPSTGVSYVWGSRVVDVACMSFCFDRNVHQKFRPTLGVPIGLDASINLWSVGDFGVSTFVIFNRRQTHGSISLQMFLPIPL